MPDPQWRGIFTGIQQLGDDLQLIARLQWFGESTNSNSGGSGPGGLRFQTLPDFYQLDLEGQWQINDMFNLSAGARNVFDEYPTKTLSATSAVAVSIPQAPSSHGRVVTTTLAFELTSKIS